jgi:hypothetical protein
MIAIKIQKSDEKSNGMTYTLFSQKAFSQMIANSLSSSIVRHTD